MIQQSYYHYPKGKFYDRATILEETSTYDRATVKYYPKGKLYDRATTILERTSMKELPYHPKGKLLIIATILQVSSMIELLLQREPL